ncbi:MAG: ATP synthase F1 subunit gamma [Deltaproteobacteria bacterium]|jgi:F-type H+-transporting ATPase subunit gamma|nr:ATP synthase F1 subunit gamma [Deltaproteobacteria bacterium]
MAKASLRDIRKRISSVRSTQQITKAMKMVAAARLRRAQESILATRPYATKMFEVLSRLAARTSAEVHPLLARREAKRVEVVVFTSDRGLCGAFNMNLIQKAEKFLEEEKARTEEVALSFIGRKGRDYFRKRNVIMRREYVNFFGKVDFLLAAKIGQELVQTYATRQVDGIYLLYSEFRSAIQQRVVLRKILPVEPKVGDEGPDISSSAGAHPSAMGRGSAVEYLYEPSEAEILDKLLPMYVEVQVYQALLESLASEYGARMTAMENATNNATEMIDKLTLIYNKARQAAITKELIEIVSGAEALK